MPRPLLNALWTIESKGLLPAPTPLRLPRKFMQLRPERLCNVPERYDRRIPRPLLQSAHVGPIHTHTRGKLGLRQPGRNPQPPHVVPAAGRVH